MNKRIEYAVNAIISTVKLELKKENIHINEIELKENVEAYLENILVEIQNDDIIIFGLAKEYKNGVRGYDGKKINNIKFKD